MELTEYLAVLRKRWMLILLAGLLCGGAAYAVTASGTPLYRSSATVYLTAVRGETTAELAQGSTYTSNLMQTYVLMATTQQVLDPVIDQLRLDTTARSLAHSVHAESPLNTYFIEISATSPDPERAAEIANAVAGQLSATVRELAPTTADGSAALRMTQVAEATPTAYPFAPRPRLMAAAGLAAGLALGVVLALLAAQLDTRVRTTRDLPRSPSRTTLGQITKDTAVRRNPAYVVEHPHTPFAEAYRRVRTNLQFVDASSAVRSIVVTSSLPGEGKSTTAVNLALVLAEHGARVLLLDADLRSPSVAEMCGLEGSAGLSTVLIHEAELEDVAQEWGTPGLTVVTAGQIPPNPSQLLESRAMAELLAAARERFDMVVIDSAPLLAVTDGAVLARQTDGAVVVARARKTRRPDLVEALASLDAVGATVLGLVVNGAQRGRNDLRYGYGTAAPGRRRHRFRRVTPPSAASHVRATGAAFPPPAGAPSARQPADDQQAARTPR